MNNKKTYIPNKYRQEIKERYLNTWEIIEISKKYWIDYDYLHKYLNGTSINAHKHEWIDYKKCSICKTWRTLDNYFSHWSKKLDKNWNKYLNSRCKICNKRIQKNRYILKSRAWELDFKEKNRKLRDKWGWRYHTRRKILKILWILWKNRRYKKQYNF